MWLLYRQSRMPRLLSHIMLIGVIYHPPDAVSRNTTDHIVDSIDNITHASALRSGCAGRF